MEVIGYSLHGTDFGVWVKAASIMGLMKVRVLQVSYGEFKRLVGWAE